MRCALGRGAAVLACGLALAAAPAGAGYYWGHGTLSSAPSLCFVGPALQNEAAWTAQILDAIREFERVAHIRFQVLGTCPPPVQLLGQDLYPGDVRIALFPGSGIPWSDPVPGDDCPIGFVDSSFGREPDFLDGDRGCLYNLKLGKDADGQGVPWRNHVLHEVGHALGLAHEHQRPDALHPSTCQPLAPSCPTPAQPGPADLLCVTAYDRDSVMNYQNTTCGIAGNYGHSGLSARDRLTLHVLYPEPVRVAEVVGTRVVRTTGTLSLASGWQARGVNVAAVARSFAWTLGGAPFGSGPSLSQSLGAGAYALGFSHEDFLGRSYAYTTTVRSLPPQQFASEVGALPALLVPEPDGAGAAALAALALAGTRRRRPRPAHRGARLVRTSAAP